MNLMVVGRYRSAYVTNITGGYQEPYVVTAQIPNHRDGHSI
jgi:hypothetical protein